MCQGSDDAREAMRIAWMMDTMLRVPIRTAARSSAFVEAVCDGTSEDREGREWELNACRRRGRPIGLSR